jgi:hypothetical protein
MASSPECPLVSAAFLKIAVHQPLQSGKKQKDAFSLTIFLFKIGHDRKRLKEKC